MNGRDAAPFRAIVLAMCMAVFGAGGCTTTATAIDGMTTGAVVGEPEEGKEVKEVKVAHAGSQDAFADVAPQPQMLGTVPVVFTNARWEAKWKEVQAVPETFYTDRECVGDICSNTRLLRLRSMLKQTRMKAADERIRIANSTVNAMLLYKPEPQASYKSDHWQALAESVTLGSGDCEDFAIAKMQLLKALGFRLQDMSLVILKKPGSTDYHAVLVVRHGGENLILDNRSDKIRLDSVEGDYRPIISFSANRMHIHGLKVAGAI